MTVCERPIEPFNPTQLATRDELQSQRMSPHAIDHAREPALAVTAVSFSDD